MTTSNFTAEPELIGFLIYRPDTDEFFGGATLGFSCKLIGYTKQPASACRFKSSHAAYAVSLAILAKTEIVELYDFGDYLLVSF